jgi:uncharacterized protein (TIGR00369 family)
VSRLPRGEIAGDDGRLQQLRAVFDRTPLKRTYGLELSITDGRAIFEMPYNAAFDNAYGSVHGGVFATLMDYAAWFTIAAKYRRCVAMVDVHVQLLERVERERLRASAELVRAGQQLAVARMRVSTGTDRLVAVGSATFAVTSIPLAALSES